MRQALFGLLWELARPHMILMTKWRQATCCGGCCGGGAPPSRHQRAARAAPPALRYGHAFPNLLFVMVICMTYSVIAPLVLPCGVLFFVGATLVYKRNLLYTCASRRAARASRRRREEEKGGGGGEEDGRRR